MIAPAWEYLPGYPKAPAEPPARGWDALDEGQRLGALLVLAYLVLELTK